MLYFLGVHLEPYQIYISIKYIRYHKIMTIIFEIFIIIIVSISQNAVLVRLLWRDIPIYDKPYKKWIAKSLQ